MLLLITSFLAGVLTSLAPCVLPLLPVIVGGSMLRDGSEKHDRLKPFIISASLVVSVVLFTVLLKVSTALSGVDPQIWTVIAGVLVIGLGVGMMFPLLWARLSLATGFEHSSNDLLGKANKHSGVAGSILTGAALGPVFSSCSPVYAVILATVLPVNLSLGLIYIVSYALGLGVALLAIALLGRRLTAHLQWAVNPSGNFRRLLGAILIIVGLLVAGGYIDKVQTWAADNLPFSLGFLENKLVTVSEETMNQGNDSEVFNVVPYKAPELVGTGDWFNSSPLNLEELQGKVVLIDFWTYSCINCIRTLPYLQQWHETYADEGFVIIGVHAPEFAFEKVSANLAEAIEERGLTYPIVQDNDFKTWRAYENRFWPAHYLIDKDGNVRREHFGEGEYVETEEAIRQLLAESGNASSDAFVTDATDGPPTSSRQTPETYLGYQRAERFANTAEFTADLKVTYALVDPLANDEWSLGGAWKMGSAQSLALQDGSALRIKFSAKEVYLVMGGEGTVTLRLNGEPVTSQNYGGEDVDDEGKVAVKEARLYKLINAPNFVEGGTLDIEFSRGVSVNAFTFGS